MIKYVGKNDTVNQYDNISELYNWLKDTKRRVGANDSSAHTDRPSWYGTDSLDSAFNLLLSGDNELYNDFIKAKDLKMERQLAQYTQRKRIKRDVVGGTVDVPSYLAGVPQCMLSKQKETYKSKVLNLVVNVAVSCGVDTSTIKSIGMKYLQIIELLEKSGYRVNLYMGMTAQDGTNKLTCLTRIKTDKEPLNIRKCVFPMVHPSMFRRVMFNWLEKCEISNGSDITNHSYGSPVQNSSVIQKQLKDCINKDYIVWNFQNCNYDKVGLDKIIEDLKERYGIEIGGNR